MAHKCPHNTLEITSTVLHTLPWATNQTGLGKKTIALSLTPLQKNTVWTQQKPNQLKETTSTCHTKRNCLLQVSSKKSKVQTNVFPFLRLEEFGPWPSGSSSYVGTSWDVYGRYQKRSQRINASPEILIYRPCKIDGLEDDSFLFETVPFQGTCSFSGVYIVYIYLSYCTWHIEVNQTDYFSEELITGTKKGLRKNKWNACHLSGSCIMTPWNTFQWFGRSHYSNKRKHMHANGP